MMTAGRIRRTIWSSTALAAVASLLISALVVIGLPSAARAAGSARIDLRVLVVSGGDLTTEALATAMDAEGVPYTKVTLTDPNRPTINAAFLTDTVDGVPRAKFEAVVLPNDNPFGAGSAEMAALIDYEKTFAIRQVDSFTFPGAAVGLTTTGGYAGSLDGMTAQVTAAGRTAADNKPGPFSYLAGPVPIDNYDPNVSEAYGYLGIPAPGPGEAFTPLVDVAVPNSTARGSIIGTFTADGREQLVMTIVANPYQTYFRALTHGIITWATKGIHLGHSRNYFTVQVDDVLAADSRWSVDHNCTPGEDCPATTPAITTPDLRMTPQDVDFLVNWQKANNFKLVMAYNAEESVSRIQDTGASDPLTDAFVANKNEFPWLNHTYSHEFLSCTKVYDTATTATGAPGESGGAVPWHCLTDAAGNVIWVSQAVIESEIKNNIDWANANGVPINPAELLTGEHSGLFYLPQVPTDNPNFVAAVDHLGITATGADASRDPNTRLIGTGTHTFPRHPMSVWFNVGTKAEEVDEYNWIYNSRTQGGSGFCDDNKTIATCIPPLDPATGFDSYIVPTETRSDLMDIITNDARPLYVHQPNLAEDRLIYPVLDSVLGAYHRLFDPSAPIVQPSVADLTNVLVDQQQWKTAKDNVSAYLQDGQVTVASSDGASHTVPVTVPEGTTVNGSAFGEAYAGQRSAWTPVGTTPVVATVPVVWDARVASQTTLTSAPNPSAAGEAVTFTATVTAAAPAVGTPTPTGTVQFKLDGTTNLGEPVPVSATGVASLYTAAVPAGTHTVQAVYNGDTAFTASTSPAVTQTVNPLAVSSLSPNTLVQGASNQTVTIAGTGFLFAPTLSFSGTGITVNSLGWNSTSQLTANLTVAADAAPGARDVTVTNPGGEIATLAGGFTVTAAPPPVTVTSLNPVNVNRGVANRAVTITGSGFAAGATVAFSGTGVTTGAVTVTSPTQITVPVSVAATATPGARDVTVSVPSGRSATLASGFTVNGPPVVTGVSPTTVPEGATQQIAIAGSNFVNGATVTVSGTGVTVGSVAYTSSTSLTANVTVAPTANPTARNVRVTNPDLRSGACTACLTVTAVPVLTSISPTSLSAGAANQAVTLNGSGFTAAFLSGGGKVDFGDGVTVLSLTRNSNTRMTARVTVSPNALPGPRNVQVNAPGGLSSALQGAFSVAAGPTITSLNPASMRRTGTAQTLVVTGAGFAAGARITFAGTGITVNSTTVNSATQLTLRVTIARTAATGMRNVTVTNRNGSTGTLPGGLVVTA